MRTHYLLASSVSVNSLKGTPMPKFVTIGYGDREGYDRTPAAIRDAAHAHDATLRKTEC